jgi:hypothetical protein
MRVRALMCCVSMTIAANAAIGAAQVAPTSYTVIETNTMVGAPQVETVYRMGQKVIIDQIPSDKASDPKSIHTRTYFDLTTQRSLTWSWPNANEGCASGNFKGDWGDPYANMEDLAGQGAKPIGIENYHGMRARVVEANGNGGAKIKAWVDTKTGLVLKVQMGAPGETPRVLLEVTNLTVGPPSESEFVLPPSCVAAAATPPGPTEEEKIAKLTGGDPKDFVSAIYGPGSKETCTAVFRVMKAQTMTPIESGFQVAVDLKVADEENPSYVMGLSKDGVATFSGGGMHEITSQMNDGTVRIENVPSQFEVDMAFGFAGTGGGTVYRHCFGPQTVLMYVVKNPEKLSEGGDFFWVKSGKFAAAAH